MIMRTPPRLPSALRVEEAERGPRRWQVAHQSIEGVRSLRQVGVLAPAIAHETSIHLGPRDT